DPNPKASPSASVCAGPVEPSPPAQGPVTSRCIAGLTTGGARHCLIDVNQTALVPCGLQGHEDEAGGRPSRSVVEDRPRDGPAVVLPGAGRRGDEHPPSAADRCLPSD